MIGKLPSVSPLRKVWVLLTPRERWRVGGLAGLSVLMGLTQVASVGAVVPFVSVLIDPESIQKNDQLRWAFETFGFSSTSSFLLFLAVGVFVTSLATNAILALTQWLLIRFSWSLQYRLSRHLLDRYLSQPYITFVGRNSADTGKNVLEEVGALTGGVVLPLLRMAAFAVAGLFVLGVLLWANPAVTVGMVAVLGGGYVVIYTLARKRIAFAGRKRIESNTQRFKAVSEAFGGIKETKVLGREDGLLRQYERPAKNLAEAQVTHAILAQLPGYGMQVLVVGVLLLLTLILLRTTGRSIADVAGLLALYAVGAQRLLPSLHQLYSGASQLRFNRVVVDTLYHDIVDGGPQHLETPGLTAAPVGARLPFAHEIRFEGVTFQYPGAATPAVREITLDIPHRAFVAFVGATGAGKTTLVDIVLGLLTPQHGRLTVDGTTVDDTTLRAWQNNLGYVPQEIYLMDDSIAANIAFGIPLDERDQAAIERAAVVANIHEFITTELPRGYDTVVGERGVRLSGGQRQRIGIARALYHEPAVLVLDEATSDLDQTTEAVVHKAIEQVAAVKTVIMIAHRLTTTWNCDKLYLMSHGQVIAEGAYGELLADSPHFQAMVGASGSRLHDGN